MTGTEWESTKHGGYRRTRVAPTTGTAQEASTEAQAIARAGVEAGGDSAQYSAERLPNTEKVGGSNPSPRTTKFIFAWRERLGLPTCPYLIRWRAEMPWFSVRLHHWLAPDDDRAPHDHPWGFTTFVLKGGYTDASPGGDQHLRAPAVRRRSAEHQHTVYPDAGGAWTVIVTGPKVRSWGFWVAGKFRKANKYFATYGHHPCE